MSIISREHDLLIIDGCNFKDDFSEEISDLNFSIDVISGIFEDGSDYYTFSKKIDYKKTLLSEVIKDSGQWFGLFTNKNNNDKIVCSDYHGFATIFYAFIKGSNTKGMIVISDSFRAVSNFIYKQGVSNSLNWEVILPHLITNTNLFTTRASKQTFHKDIYTLNHNEVFYIKDKEVTVIKRSKLFRRSSLNYKQLMLSGIDKAIKNFELATKTNRKVCFNLSGGKDSRVVLAMLLHSKSRDNINILTANPFNLPSGASKDILLEDFHLSSKISEYYKLNWFNREHFSQYKLSYDEQLNIWQDFRSNSSFELKIKTSQIKDCNELRITGIGGELIRSYLGSSYKNNFPQWWSEVISKQLNTTQSLELLFRYLCNPWLIDSDLYQDAKESFVKSFTFNTSFEILEQIDESYLAYRSRAHSGVRNVHDFEGAVLHYPLAQVDFCEASELLDKHDQDEGKLIFDIISETAPELNYLKFASPAWPERFLENEKSINFSKLWKSVSSSKKEESYKSISKEVRANTFSSRDIEDFNILDSSFNRLSRNIDIIRNCQSDIIDFGSIVERIARLQQKNINSLNSLVAKTETIIDVLVPSVVPLNIVKLNLEKNEIEMSLKKVHNSSSLQTVLKKIDLTSVETALNYSKEKSSLTVYYKHVPHDCVIAIYFYIDGVRKSIEWYKNRTEATFDVSFSNENMIRLMSFIKRIGEPEAQRIINDEMKI